MNLPEFSVRRPVGTWMIFFAVIMIGMVSFFNMPIDLLPEIDIPAITVQTPYEGAGPEDVETQITEVMERAMATVPDLRHIESTSREGMSVVTLQFEFGTDLDTRSNDVRDAAGMARRFLPDGAEDPRVFKFDLSQFPILVYAVTAEESYSGLETILQDEIADPLNRIEGVGSVTLHVPLNRQMNVYLDRERMASYGLTPHDIARVINAENKDTPAGNIKTGSLDYLVRVPGEFASPRELEQIVVSNHNGNSVRLHDVGVVEDGFEEVSSVVRLNGRPAGIFFIQKQSGANTVTVARDVQKRMNVLVGNLPPDIQITNVMDSSDDIVRAVNDLGRTLLMGAGLAMLVVLVFLRRIRATFVVGFTIPFSLIVGLIMMYFLGYTINMMTLFGLIIAVGMVVDNAIVVLENITRHREEGERTNEAAMYGASEVAMAITASTLTTLCIFFPILFVQGITRILFAEFAIVICVVLLGSLFSAITLTPMLTTTFMKSSKSRSDRRKNKESEGWLYRKSEAAFDWLGAFYSDALGWTLGHKTIVIMLAVAVFASSLFLIRVLGTEFMPEQDDAQLRGEIHLPVGTRLEETAEVIRHIERILIDEVLPEERIAFYTMSGGGGGGGGGMGGQQGPHIGQFGLRLVPIDQRERNVDEIAATVRSKFEEVAGRLGIERFEVTTGNPMSAMMGGGTPVRFNIIGDDLETTDALAEQIRRIVADTPGAVDAVVSRTPGRPELRVNVDRERASAMGLNVSQVAETIRASIYGRMAGVYRGADEIDEYDIFVRFREDDRRDLSDALAVPIRLPDGTVVRTDNLATLTLDTGPLEIERRDQGRMVSVTSGVYGRSVGEVVSDVETKIAELELPPRVEIEVAGQAEEQRDAFLWLFLALGVGIMLVYMVMAWQFESFLHPFVVMFSLPFAISGAIFMLLFTGHYVSIVVFLGLLMLIGIVVNNAIVLVDYINILRERGLSMQMAIKEAGRRRLRPVLMTAITTIVALIPMAFGTGQGAEVWNPLGATVIGGLVMSTLVSLLIVPVMYSILERKERAVEK